LLKETIDDEICCCINAIIDRLDILTRGDDQLRDNLIRSRMIHPEFKDLIGGFALLLTAKVVATSDLDLSGAETIDGAAVGDGDTVLATGQTLPAENGVYEASAGGAWSRVSDLPDGWTPTSDDDAVYVWVQEGDTYQFSAWVWNPSQDADAAVVGTTEQTWHTFHQTLIPTLDADTLAALAGTEGTPDATNLFVTDEDPRLDPFGDTQDGLVPQPGATSTCTRFLCEDGSWSEPAVAVLTDVMKVNVNNVMTADGEITFPSIIGIHGLIDPANDDDAANKGYVDDLYTAIAGVLTALTSWKDDLDALSGLIECDGAGSYSAYDISSLEALETALDDIDGLVKGDGSGGFTAADMTEDGSGNVTVNGTLTVDDDDDKGLRLASGGENWKTVQFSIVALINSLTANQPGLRILGASSIRVGSFTAAPADESVYGAFDLPLDYAEGSDIRFYVVWAPMDTNAGNVVWQVDYEVVRDGNVAGSGSSSAQSIDAAGGTAWIQKRALFATISGGSFQVGDHVYFRLRRKSSSGSDTYASYATASVVGCYYKANSIGSVGQASKD
jgi:hypothetical protein